MTTNMQSLHPQVASASESNYGPNANVAVSVQSLDRNRLCSLSLRCPRVNHRPSRNINRCSCFMVQRLLEHSAVPSFADAGRMLTLFRSEISYDTGSVDGGRY